MSFGRFYKTTKYQLSTDVTGSDNVLLGPIDISDFQNLVIIIKNSSTQVTYAVDVQVATDPRVSASDVADRWFTLATVGLNPQETGKYTALSIGNNFQWLRLSQLVNEMGEKQNLTIQIGGRV